MFFLFSLDSPKQQLLISRGSKQRKFVREGFWRTWGDICRAVGEILPLQKSMEKPRKTKEKLRQTKEKQEQRIFHYFFVVFSVLTPAELKFQFVYSIPW